MQHTSLLKLRISHGANVTTRCKGFQGVNAQGSRHRKPRIGNEEPQVRDCPSVVSRCTMPIVLIPAMDEIYQPWMKLHLIHVPATASIAHRSASIHPPWGPAQGLHVFTHPKLDISARESTKMEHAFLSAVPHPIFDGKGIKDRWRSSACYLNSEACVNPTTNKLVWLCNLTAISELQAGSTTHLDIGKVSIPELMKNCRAP